MIGRRFQRLTVIAELPERQIGKRVYLCRCDCGNETRCVGGNLKSGTSKSCGCLRTDRLHERWRHGRGSRDRTYRVWSTMRTRCRNPRNQKYADYGGRGITVCSRWDSFENFLADMGEAPPEREIDRIDNDSGYKPGNCRWATRREQSLNKRTTRRIYAFGATKPLTIWAEEYGLPVMMVWKRLHRGWTPERALTTPSLRSA